MNELGPSKRFKSKLKIDALQNGRFLNIKVMNVQSNFKVSIISPYGHPFKVNKKDTGTSIDVTLVSLLLTLSRDLSIVVVYLEIFGKYKQTDLLLSSLKVGNLKFFKYFQVK